MSLGGDKEVYILKCLKTLDLTQWDTPLAPLLLGLLSKICGFDQAPFTQDHLWESLSPIEIQGKAGPCDSEHGPLSGVGPQNLQKGERAQTRMPPSVWQVMARCPNQGAVVVQSQTLKVKTKTKTNKPLTK